MTIFEKTSKAIVLFLAKIILHLCVWIYKAGRWVLSILSKAGRWLLLFFKKWDGLWSIPVAFALFIGAGILLQWLYPESVTWALDIWQTAILACGVMVLFNLIIWLGMYFNFTSVFLNLLKDKTFLDGLSPIQKTAVSISIYFGLLIALITIFIILV